jgi:hypothetical protein
LWAGGGREEKEQVGEKQYKEEREKLDEE